MKTLITSLKREKRELANKVSEFETNELERSEQDQDVERRIEEAKNEFNDNIDDMRRDNESKVIF